MTVYPDSLEPNEEELNRLKFNKTKNNKQEIVWLNVLKLSIIHILALFGVLLSLKAHILTLILSKFF